MVNTAKIQNLQPLITDPTGVHLIRLFITVVAIGLAALLVWRMLHADTSNVRLMAGITGAYALVTALQQVMAWNVPVTSRAMYAVGVSILGLAYLVYQFVLWLTRPEPEFIPPPEPDRPTDVEIIECLVGGKRNPAVDVLVVKVIGTKP